MKSIISIHDVMPETMDRVLKLIEWLEALKVPPSTLLVAVSYTHLTLPTKA